MSSGPCHILVLSHTEGSAGVIPTWREFIGPTDIDEAKREKPERLDVGIIHVVHSGKKLRKKENTFQNCMIRFDEIPTPVSLQRKTFVKRTVIHFCTVDCNSGKWSQFRVWNRE